MDPLRIGIMGFGRVGRDLFRRLYDADDVQIAAVCDIAEPEALEYLLRFDTLHGRFPTEVSVKEGQLFVVGRPIPLLRQGEPGLVPWGELGVDVVVEATGRARSRAAMERHLERGAGRVVLCVPPLDPPDVTIVRGVNDDRLSPDHRIVSNGSCTAHAAVPLLRILHDAFGVERALLTSVHAYTNHQRLADVPAEDPRRGRAAAENIIPQETQVASIIEELLPALSGRVTGCAMNVPVPNGSLVDLVCWHERPVSRIAINEVVRTAATAPRWLDVVEYEPEPIVSTDVLDRTHSAVFDAPATTTLGERVSKTITWYDNSWSYVSRLVDLLRQIRELRNGDEEVA